jgi:hypothetical protein
MNGIERRQFEMLVRVRNFGNTHATLFASPAARETVAGIGTAIDDLTTTDMKKMSASASARADRKAIARRALTDLLQNMTLLAKNLRAEGREMPGFALPPSRSDVSLITAGRQFAVDAGPFEADFAGHGMGFAYIAAITTAFEAAVHDQGMSRTEHVAAKARIRDLLASAIRGVRRLDLIVGNDLRHDNVVQTQWKQLRRLEDPRGPRNGGQADTAAAGAGDAPAAAPAAETPAPQPA